MNDIARHLWFIVSAGLDATRSRRIVVEVLFAAVFLYFTVRTENFFAKRVFEPLLKRLFGDGQELMDELNRKEKEMQDAAQQ